MDDPQEFNSLDELFRKTFDDLPDKPAASGWDKPNARVWDKVQAQIKPPNSGWSSKSIFLVSSMAIVLMLGLYWAITRPDQPVEASPAAENTTASAPDEKTENRPLQSDELDIRTPSANVERAQQDSPVQSRLESNATSNAPSNNTSENLNRSLPAGSAPLPGTRPASPNTTVRRQLEAWRGAPWAQPLAPLPSILESQFIRPVPESLKKLRD